MARSSFRHVATTVTGAGYPDGNRIAVRYTNIVKLLIVEDTRKTADLLQKGLGQHGFVTDVAADGDSAVRLCLAGHYDAMVIDVMIPALDGYDLLAALRKHGIKTPAIFLTARGTIEDRLRGFEVGADDYLVKPFAISELTARIHAITRRGQQLQPENIEIADLRIDPARHRATRGGTLLPLTPKEFKLLSLMARHRGQVLSRSLIAERVWDMYHDPGTNVVDVHIKRLRAKVDSPFAVKLIHTVRGVGYRLDAEE
jgi:two-component system, OmpR family, copper resistance phosphate regulon response regulator CusR